MFRFTHSFVALAALGVLACCVGPPPGTGQGAAHTRAGTAGGYPRTAAPAQETEGVPAPGPEALVEVNADPGRLAGLDANGVTGLLGVPDFRRRDGGTELWRYRHAACALDLFLYPPTGIVGGSTTVHHYAARSRTDRELTTRDCLGALLRARLKKNAG